MDVLHVTTREGVEHDLAGARGLSIMELVRDGGIDEMLALCGGNCSCATCQIYVDPAFANLLPPVSADEDDLLETSAARTAQSRLSCQIIWTAALAGLKVTVAPADA